jgi:hypothetical protein
LEAPVAVLHLYAEPGDPGSLGAEQSFAAARPWFHVSKLEARSHPRCEVPDEMAAAIETFAN